MKPDHQYFKVERDDLGNPIKFIFCHSPPIRIYGDDPCAEHCVETAYIYVAGATDGDLMNLANNIFELAECGVFCLELLEDKGKFIRYSISAKKWIRE